MDRRKHIAGVATMLIGSVKDADHYVPTYNGRQIKNEALLKDGELELL